MILRWQGRARIGSLNVFKIYFLLHNKLPFIVEFWKSSACGKFAKNVIKIQLELRGKLY
jgi:hypothetical protein